MTTELRWYSCDNPPACPECSGDTMLCSDIMELPRGCHILGEGEYPQKRKRIEHYLRCNCGWQSARLDFSMGWWSEPPWREIERTRWKAKDVPQ